MFPDAQVCVLLQTTLWNEQPNMFNVSSFFFFPQHVFTMDPTNVENGRGKVPHDPSLPFASTFNGTSHVIVHIFLIHLLSVSRRQRGYKAVASGLFGLEVENQ